MSYNKPRANLLCYNLDWPTIPATPFSHLIARGDLSIDNTINIVFGVLTFILGVLSVAFAWAMWLLNRQVNRNRQQQITAWAIPEEEDLELHRIARDHHGNYVTL